MEAMNLHFRVEEVIERRTGQWCPSAIGEFLHCPVCQARLLIIEEEASILHGWRAVRAPSGGDEHVRILCCRNISPPYGTFS